MGCPPFLKARLPVFEGMIFLGGLVVLSVGIWVKVDSSSIEKFLAVEAPQVFPRVVQVAYLCMAVGSFSILVAFLGFWGALRGSRGLLLLFFGLMLVLFIAEVVGVAMALELSAVADVYVPRMEEWASFTLREGYARKENTTAIWDATMRKLQCCGVQGYMDFTTFDEIVTQYRYPVFCCKSGTKCNEDLVDTCMQGCLPKLQEFLIGKAKIIGGLYLGVGLLQLAAMAISWTDYLKMGRSC